MQRREKFHPGIDCLRPFPGFIFLLILLIVPLTAQYDYYAEDDSAYFWEEGEYDTSEYYEDDYYYEDEYDTTTYYEDEYYEDEYYYDDEYYEEDTTAAEYESEGGYYEYDTDSGEDVEDRGAGDISSTELVERAQRMGYSLSIAYSSPGFVNHALNTYNSYADYRIGVELPMLMQMLGTRFRLGLEFGTFSFDNYMPSGGEYKGNTIFGLVSFPAGPGQVKIGGGMIGEYYGYMAETTYGFALGNILDVRVGVRATSALDVVDTSNNAIGTASWLDGLVVLGVNF